MSDLDPESSRLLKIAQAALRRVNKANAVLNKAEREKLIAWRNYDIYRDDKRVAETLTTAEMKP